MDGHKLYSWGLKEDVHNIGPIINEKDDDMYAEFMLADNRTYDEIERDGKKKKNAVPPTVSVKTICVTAIPGQMRERPESRCPRKIWRSCI